MTIKVSPSTYAGAKNQFGPNGLGAAIRGLAIDNARRVVKAANIADLTDSTTGTAGASVVDLPMPQFYAALTGTGGAPVATLNSALGKIVNAHKGLGVKINAVRSIIGLPVLVIDQGTEATPGTLPALDKATGSGVSATSAVDYGTGVAALSVIKANQRKLTRAWNEALASLGEAQLPSAMAGSVSSDVELHAMVNASASATGARSLAKTDVDAFLLKAVNNVATLAASINSKLPSLTAGLDGLRVVAVN